MSSAMAPKMAYIVVCSVPKAMPSAAATGIISPARAARRRASYSGSRSVSASSSRRTGRGRRIRST